MSVSLAILILYIAALFAISWYAKKRSEGEAENYALAGRKLNTPLIAVTIIGLAVGGASTIGVSEHAFRVGLSAGWYTIAWALGAIVMGMFMAKKYREQNITTISELIERHHDMKAVVLGVFCQIVIQLVIISLQYIAGGGMWSASLSNVMNIVLIYVGILIATVVQFYRVGGMEGLAASLPAGVPWFSFTEGVGMVTITSWVVTLITVNLSLQSILQISLGAKDAETAKKGFVWGGIIMLPVGVLAAFLGICAKAMYPDAQAALALPEVIVSLQPLLAGITLAALWAADVSTACNLLLSAGTLFSNDIYKRFINPAADGSRQILMTRLCVMLTGLMTLGLAMTVSSILGTIMIGLSLTAAFTVIVIVALFFPQHSCKEAGFWTLLAGFVMLILWQFFPAVRILPNIIYMEWLVCIIAYALVAVIKPGKKAA